MNILWFKGLNDEEKERRKQYLLSNSDVLDLVVKVLEKEFKEYTPDYGSPSWAYEQSHANGYNQALKRVAGLLTVKE